IAPPAARPSSAAVICVSPVLSVSTGVMGAESREAWWLRHPHRHPTFDARVVCRAQPCSRSARPRVHEVPGGARADPRRRPGACGGSAVDPADVATDHLARCSLAALAGGLIADRSDRPVTPRAVLAHLPAAL